MTCALLKNESGMDSEEGYTMHTIKAFEEVVEQCGMKWVWRHLCNETQHAIIDVVDSWEGSV